MYLPSNLNNRKPFQSTSSGQHALLPNRSIADHTTPTQIQQIAIQILSMGETITSNRKVLTPLRQELLLSQIARDRPPTARFNQNDFYLLHLTRILKTPLFASSSQAITSMIRSFRVCLAFSMVNRSPTIVQFVENHPVHLGELLQRHETFLRQDRSAYSPRYDSLEKEAFRALFQASNHPTKCLPILKEWVHEMLSKEPQLVFEIITQTTHSTLKYDFLSTDLRMENFLRSLNPKQEQKEKSAALSQALLSHPFFLCFLLTKLAQRHPYIQEKGLTLLQNVFHEHARRFSNSRENQATVLLRDQMLARCQHYTYWKTLRRLCLEFLEPSPHLREIYRLHSEKIGNMIRNDDARLVQDLPLHIKPKETNPPIDLEGFGYLENFLIDHLTGTLTDLHMRSIKIHLLAPFYALYLPCNQHLQDASVHNLWHRLISHSPI